MSRNGEFEEFKGGSSEVIVREALKFLQNRQQEDAPFFVVIWYGSPHSPWMAEEEDKKAFRDLRTAAQNHYGELVDMDNSIGLLREALGPLGFLRIPWCGLTVIIILSGAVRPGLFIIRMRSAIRR